MDVITAYLETMFSPYPQTERLLAAKADLREMMEDAYTAAIGAGRSHNEAVGQVITEFGNLDELAPVLGITADLGGRSGVAGSASEAGSAAAKFGADQPGVAQPVAGQSAGPVRPDYPAVTMDEAQGYAEAQRSGHPFLALGIALFVLSPIPLLFLSIFGRNPRFPLSTEIGSLIGIVAVLVIVPIGIALMMASSRRLEPFERIGRKRFTPDPAVTAWAKDLKATYAGRRTTALTVAISFWVLSALPVISSGFLRDSFPVWGEELPGIGVPLTLVMVAIGLLISIPSAWADTAADALTAEPSEEEEEEASYPAAVRVMMALLWPTALIVYLGWSFLSGAWHISWLVWPIAGVLMWGLSAVGSTLRRSGHAQ